MDDPLTPCPICDSPNVERHYSRHADGDWPGCVDCEQTLSMEEWAARVLAVPGRN